MNMNLLAALAVAVTLASAMTLVGLVSRQTSVPPSVAASQIVRTAPAASDLVSGYATDGTDVPMNLYVENDEVPMRLDIR